MNLKFNKTKIKKISEIDKKIRQVEEMFDEIQFLETTKSFSEKLEKLKNRYMKINIKNEWIKRKRIIDSIPQYSDNKVMKNRMNLILG